MRLASCSNGVPRRSSETIHIPTNCEGGRPVVSLRETRPERRRAAAQHPDTQSESRFSRAERVDCAAHEKTIDAARDPARRSCSETPSLASTRSANRHSTRTIRSVAQRALQHRYLSSARPLPPPSAGRGAEPRGRCGFSGARRRVAAARRRGAQSRRAASRSRRSRRRRRRAAERWLLTAYGG